MAGLANCRHDWSPTAGAQSLYEAAVNELTADAQRTLFLQPLRTRYALVLVAVVGLTHVECGALMDCSHQTISELIVGAAAVIARAAAEVAA